MDIIEALENELKTADVKKTDITVIINNIERSIKRPLTFDEATMLIKLSSSQINVRNTLKLLFKQ